MCHGESVCVGVVVSVCVLRGCVCMCVCVHECLHVCMCACEYFKYFKFKIQEYYLIREIKMWLNINHITVHSNTFCIF